MAKIPTVWREIHECWRALGTGLDTIAKLEGRLSAFERTLLSGSGIDLQCCTEHRQDGSYISMYMSNATKRFVVSINVFMRAMIIACS